MNPRSTQLAKLHHQLGVRGAQALLTFFVLLLATGLSFRWADGILERCQWEIIESQREWERIIRDGPDHFATTKEQQQFHAVLTAANKKTTSLQSKAARWHWLVGLNVATWPLLIIAIFLRTGMLSHQWTTARRRALAGQCVHCGYDLRGSDSEICPECGTAR